MNDVLLISVDDIKEVTSISKSIEASLLEPYISISEESYCYDVIGDALKSQLKDQITGNTLTDLNKSLLVQYVRPLIAYGAWHEYLPFSAIKTTQKGEVRQSSDSSNVADLNEVTFKRNALKDKITFYQKRLTDYLNKNRDQYPLYRSTCSVNTGNNWSIYLGGAN